MAPLGATPRLSPRSIMLCCWKTGHKGDPFGSEVSGGEVVDTDCVR